jgi:ribosomal protein L40E
MVKKTLGYVELEWTCSQCGTRNPGSAKVCASCGAAQPENVTFQQAAEEELITDKDEIARAKAGPDVHCAFCGTRNAAGAERCTQCGADLSSAAARESGQVLGAFRDGPAQQVKCPSCGTLNPANAYKCSQCNASLPRTERPEPRKPAAQARKPASKGLKFGIIALAAFILLACVILFAVFNPFTPAQEIVGTVQGHSWSRSIAIEGLRDVSDEDWRDKIPAGARLGRCTEKLHHTQDHPAPGAEEVCGTPYVVNTGTGHGEVVQDCEYKVYADWCAYTTQQWTKVDVVTLEGEDRSPRWPDLALRAQQREGDRDESYQVRFDTGEEIVTYRTSDPDALNQFQVGSRWLLRVNARGGARPIERAQ